jgi:hypothetical protein
MFYFLAKDINISESPDQMLNFDISKQLSTFTTKYILLLCVQQEKLNGLILQKDLDL